MLKKNSLIPCSLLLIVLGTAACISRVGREATPSLSVPPPHVTPTGVILVIPTPSGSATFLPSIISSASPGVSSPSTTPPATGLQNTPEMPQGTPSGDLAALPISFPITSPEMAVYFNQIAHPEDIALIPNGYLNLLSEITSGKVRIGFASWADAQRELPSLADRIDVVVYNPEHWEQTPAAEKENLPNTVQDAAHFSRDQGVKFMVTPDRRFAKDYLAEIAPHADFIGLQGQRLQDNPQAFENWAREMISVVRARNPEAKIFVQVGATQGPAEEMFAAIQTIAGEIDGISIWTTPRTLAILKEFISMIRPTG